MHVLIVKTSSMGDVIHTLPALTDAYKAHSSIAFDWVVEESFAEIPRWHPQVKKIIPVAIRRWRKNLFAPKTRVEFKKFYEELKKTPYDFIIDAQGLLKSALIARLAKGTRCGFDSQSVREVSAALFYQCSVSVDKKQHAITRLRNLFSQILHYEFPTSIPDYGIDKSFFISTTRADSPYLVFLHGTTWNTKHWPEEYWIELVRLANQHGFKVKLPWGNVFEQERAQRIGSHCTAVEILPRLGLAEMAKVLAGAKAWVGVDTGLGHLAAAFNIPGVSLYGPTDSELTGALGRSQVHLAAQFPCAPCLSRKCTYFASPFYSPLNPPCLNALQPSRVWEAVKNCFD